MNLTEIAQSICHSIFGEQNTTLLSHLIKEVLTMIVIVVILIMGTNIIKFIFNTWGKDVIFLHFFVSIMHELSAVVGFLGLLAKGARNAYKWSRI